MTDVVFPRWEWPTEAALEAILNDHRTLRAGNGVDDEGEPVARVEGTIGISRLPVVITLPPYVPSLEVCCVGLLLRLDEVWGKPYAGVAYGSTLTWDARRAIRGDKAFSGLMRAYLDWLNEPNDPGAASDEGYSTMGLLADLGFKACHATLAGELGHLSWESEYLAVPLASGRVLFCAGGIWWPSFASPSMRLPGRLQSMDELVTRVFDRFAIRLDELTPKGATDGLDESAAKSCLVSMKSLCGMTQAVLSTLDSENAPEILIGFDGGKFEIRVHGQRYAMPGFGTPWGCFYRVPRAILDVLVDCIPVEREISSVWVADDRLMVGPSQVGHGLSVYNPKTPEEG